MDVLKVIGLMYTAEQIKPKRHPDEEPSSKGDFWTIHRDNQLVYNWWFYNNPRHWRFVEWFIDVPGAPPELRFQSYPEVKPIEGGIYMCHSKTYDDWDSLIYENNKWGAGYDIDWFIPYNLDEEEREMENVIWETDELKVYFDEQIELQDAWTRNFITLPVDELTAFASCWLTEHAGYDVVKREPELKPCPNPECECKKYSVDCDEYDDESHYWVRCEMCGLAGPIEFSKREAIEAWNALPRK